ncbi:t-SNARE [Kalaharituber pfeilii]|nr:t-SNARE [Kalaharituber pfeilii]
MNQINQGGGDDEFFREVSEIDHDIENMKRNTQNIKSVHNRSLQDIDTQSIEYTQEELRKLSDDASVSNRALSTRIRILKGKVHGDPGRNAQAERVEKLYKSALIEYQKVVLEFQERVKEQIKRQYKIVKPDATEEELEQACNDGQTQLFSQAVLSGTRRGEAQSTLSAVQARHKEIQRIEQTIIELAELFQNMEQLIIEQEPMVEQIDQRGQEIQEDIAKAHTELQTAVTSARSRRRKKWWCLLIALLIIIIIVVVVVVTQVINKQASGGN